MFTLYLQSFPPPAYPSRLRMLDTSLMGVCCLLTAAHACLVHLVELEGWSLFPLCIVLANLAYREDE
jgi:hypothetical protein